jgi:hypothetical protein
MGGNPSDGHPLQPRHDERLSQGLDQERHVVGPCEAAKVAQNLIDPIVRHSVLRDG